MANEKNKTKEADKPKTAADPKSPGTDVATVAPKPMSLTERALSVGGVAFKIAKQVTVPLLKHEENSVVYFTVQSAIYMGKEIKNKKDGTTVAAPAPMIKVFDLETRSNREYIVPAVLAGVFEDQYPKESYVGKSFAVNKLPLAPGKRYKPVEVLEIEVDPNATPAT